MNSFRYLAEAEPAARLQAQAFLRRHAMAAAKHFAAEAQLEIEDEALALMAECMIAVTLTNVPESGSPLPHAVMAAARLLFARDELKVARAEVRKEGSLDLQDARERAETVLARFFTEVETGWSIGSGDQTLKAIQGRRILSADYATGMRRLIAAWQKRRRRERQVPKRLGRSTCRSRLTKSEVRSTVHLDPVRTLTTICGRTVGPNSSPRSPISRLANQVALGQRVENQRTPTPPDAISVNGPVDDALQQPKAADSAHEDFRTISQEVRDGRQCDCRPYLGDRIAAESPAPCWTAEPDANSVDAPLDPGRPPGSSLGSERG